MRKMETRKWSRQARGLWGHVEGPAEAGDPTLTLIPNLSALGSPQPECKDGGWVGPRCSQAGQVKGRGVYKGIGVLVRRSFR